MIITKQWYIIHRNGSISQYGHNDPNYTICLGKGASVAEFDTEAEMLDYIEQNNLKLPKEFDNEN